MRRIAIGRTTAQRLRELGFEAEQTAPSPSPQGVLQALQRALQIKGDGDGDGDGGCVATGGAEVNN